MFQIYLVFLSSSSSVVFALSLIYSVCTCLCWIFWFWFWIFSLPLSWQPSKHVKSARVLERIDAIVFRSRATRRAGSRINETTKAIMPGEEHVYIDGTLTDVTKGSPSYNTEEDAQEACNLLPDCKGYCLYHADSKYHFAIAAPNSYVGTDVSSGN